MSRPDDAVALLAECADHRLIGRVHRAQQREFSLEAEACILLDQPRRIRAGFHSEDRVDLQIRKLTEIRAEVGRIERMPELLDYFATAFGEDLGETAALFVAEGVILADGRNLLVTLLQTPVAERMGKGAPGVSGDTDDILDALALRQVVGRDDRNEIR